MSTAHRTRAAVGGIALLVAIMTGVGSAQEVQVPSGQDLWRSCSSCHGVPDRRIPQDRDWLQLNRTTTCISGDDARPEMRQALIDYLDAETTHRPLLVTEDFKADVGMKTGEIDVPATSGSAYLKADRESIRSGSPTRIRLNWKASEAGKTLVVPAGNFRVINYAFYRVDADKKRWSISGSSAEGCADFVFGADRKAVLDLLPEIDGKLSALADETAIEAEDAPTEYGFGFFMTNTRGERLSIACNGKLVDPTWVVRDQKGEIIDRGKFEVT